MIQLKKTILTLVALLAVTTGAWAQGPVDGTIAWSVGNEASATVSASIMDAISSTGVTTGSGLTVSTCKYFDTNMMKYQPSTANAGNVSGVMIEYTIEAVDGYKFKPTGVDYAAVKDGSDNISYSWSYTIDGVESAITDVSKDDLLRSNGSNSGTAQLMHSESITADGCSVFTLRFYISNCGTSKNICIGNITISGSVSAAAASGPEVAWDKAKKTGTFTMPGGNVTLEPEYYPQAALTAAPTAINDVPATTDGAIVKAGTVATIGSTETAQGTVMYYVSPTALGDAALLALAADQWTADVPTAKSLAQGQAYVYYYVRGNDSDTDEENFSDGDILAANALTVTIAPEPTYAVTFAEGTEESDKWKAEPNAGVTKGQTVTVTYTGTKKVIGVKAEKKAAASAKPLANATAEDLGKIAGADGNIYDTKAAAEAAGTTAVAMIAYVGSDTGNDTYTHGMALALSDEGEMNWSNAKSTCEGKSAVSGAAWLLPSRNQWKAMFKANGGNEGSYTGLNTAVATAGGDSSKLQKNERYWSSSEQGSNFAWVLVLGEDNAGWDGAPEDLGHHVRACLAF